MRLRYGRITLLLLIIVGTGLPPDCGSVPADHFRRVDFQHSRGQGVQPLKFDRKTFSWTDGDTRIRHKWARRITRGTGIRVRHRGVLKALPELDGRGGFWVNVFARGEPGRLTVRVILRRGTDTLFRRVIKKINKEYFYQHVAREGEFQPGDEVFVEVLGRGEVVVGDLVAYRILPPEERRYVFLVAVDNLRRDAVGRTYEGVHVTPHIDDFARDAVFFEQTFAQSSWTLPSFMSMFSAWYPDRLGIRSDAYLPFTATFLTEHLSRRLITVNFNGGSWMQSSFGNSRGFDVMGYSGGAESSTGARRLFTRATGFLNHHRVPDLFMFCHTYHVHSPFVPEPVFLKKLNKAPRYRELRNFTGKNQFIAGILPERKQALTELYLAEAMGFDHHFGQFVSHLKSQGLYEKSMIIILSDHGEAFGEHGGWFHGHTLYNELVRVPFIIKFPGNEYRGKRISHLAGLVDVFPTLLNYFDIPVPPGGDGISLLPAVEQDKPVRTRLWSVLAPPINSHLPVRLAMISGEWKLIRNLSYPDSATRFYAPGGSPPLPRYQLFHLGEDPGETRNVFRFHRREVEEWCEDLEKRLRELIRLGRNTRRPNVVLEQEDQEQLRSLGYID